MQSVKTQGYNIRSLIHKRSDGDIILRHCSDAVSEDYYGNIIFKRRRWKNQRYANSPI